MPTHPYLHFQGTCAEAMAFYAQALHGTDLALMRYAESPGAPEGWTTSGNVMHAQVRIGDGVLMASDFPPSMEGDPQKAFSVMQTFPTPEATRDAFDRLGSQNRKAFVAYVMAGDPDYDTSLQIVLGLPGAGVDIIELGLPFTDPMADGPTIQLAGQRALAAGQTLDRTLDIARRLRERDQSTPIVLMGYYNPIHSRGVDTFLAQAREAGIDGLIVVDLPPEEDAELCLPAQAAGLNFIRLATPTTDDRRLPTVLRNTSGFVYYVSITGITGAAAAQSADVGPEVARIKAQTDLPVIVGFGIRTPDTARAIASVADGAVVGSAIVSEIAQGRSPGEVLAFVRSLAEGAHAA